MNSSEEQQQRIMGYFIEEAREHLQTIEQGVLNLQEILDDPESINEVFRAAHSIKGGSAMLGVGSIQHISHRLEDFFKILRENPQIKVDERLKSLLLAGFDPLAELLDELQVGFKISDELTHETNTRVKPIFAELESYLHQLVSEGDAAATPQSEVTQKPSELTLVAVDSLEVIFQREVTTKMRDMLQLFRGEDSLDSRSQLQDICNYFQKLGNDFDLHNWTNLSVQSKNAIAQPSNSYRTLAPIVIRELKEAQDLVLANREAEIAISTQLRNLLPYAFDSNEDDEVSTIFTTAPNTNPAISPRANASQPSLSIVAEPPASLASDFDRVAEDEDPDQIDLLAGADEESFELGTIDDSAIEQLDWIDGDYEISEEQTIDGPKIGATELKSLAILFENDDIDFDSAWEDIESNESNIANQGVNLNANTRDDFADLLDGDSSIGEANSFRNSQENLSIEDPLFGDFSKQEEELAARSATTTQSLFPEDTEISWRAKDDDENGNSDSELDFLQDGDLGIDIIDQLDQTAGQEIYADNVREIVETSKNIIDDVLESDLEPSDLVGDEPFAIAFTGSDMDDPFAIDDSLDADLLNDFNVNDADQPDILETETLDTIGTQPTASALIESSADFDTGDTSGLSIFDELGFDDDSTAANQGNFALGEVTDNTNVKALEQIALEQAGTEATDFGNNFGDDFFDSLDTGNLSSEDNLAVIDSLDSALINHEIINHEINDVDNDQEFADFFTDSLADAGAGSIPTATPNLVERSDSLEDLEDFFAGEEEVAKPVQSDISDDDFASVIEDVNWDSFDDDFSHDPSGLNPTDDVSLEGLTKTSTDNDSSFSLDQGLDQDFDEAKVATGNVESGDDLDFGDFINSFEEDGLNILEAGLSTVGLEEPQGDDSFLDFADEPLNDPPTLEAAQGDRSMSELVSIFADADTDQPTLVEQVTATRQELEPSFDQMPLDAFDSLDNLDNLEGLNDLNDLNSLNDFADINGFEQDFDNALESSADSDLVGFLEQNSSNDHDIATEFDQFGDFDEMMGSSDRPHESRSLTQEQQDDRADSLDFLEDSFLEETSSGAIADAIASDQPIAVDDGFVDNFADDFAEDFDDLAADLGSNSDIDIHTSTNTIDNLVDFFQDDESDLSDVEASGANQDTEQEMADFAINQPLDQNELDAEILAINSDFDSFQDFDLEIAPNQEPVTKQAMPTSPPSQEITGIDDNFDFDDLEAMLGDTGNELSSPSKLVDFPTSAEDQTFIQESTLASPSSPSGDMDFDDLEALLGDTGGNDLGISSPTLQVDSLPAPSDDFGDLEDMLQSKFANDVGPIKTKQANRPAVNPRKQRIADTTMRVDVKYLDSLNNLVGELVVNRNLLEQEQERLQQFITNLLHQVQLLSDVSQRMRDQYDRSLLEASLSAGRGSRSTSVFESAVYGGESNANGVTSDFEGIEFDRYNTFHVLSQEIIELIVRVRESASDIEFVVGETDQVTRQLGTITTQIQDDLKQSRMVPFAQIADRLPRGIRDRALKTGKQAELEIYGRETLIDKAILESLTDPLTHLVNNAIDHGLEDPATRQAAGKSPVGKLTVRAYHQGNQTVISISDDGAGISVEKVKKSAVAKRVRTQTEVDRLNDNEVYALLFEPGFSTAAQADEFKGRGVGLDVVKTCLDEIRGVIIVESVVGKGTSFTIRLPLTLSISKAMFCISDRARIAFPVDGFEDMVEVPQSQIVLNEKGQPCLPWRDTVLPFQHLSNLLSYNRHISRSSIYGKQENDELCIIILRNDTNYLALQVDQFLGESEIVIKQLEGPIPQPAGIAGATVLGDGRVMAIANVLELFDIASGRLRPSSSHTPIQPVVEEDIAVDPTMLIVDDSITVRELLSLTFAKVGYRVEQAKDGQDAWEKLRAGLPCDMIFCDIEMPRMDGLDLLSRLQKDSRLKDIPVAMLTSRGADRHRQSAIQLGAKGYFTKPYLEEELLSASKRLLNGETLPI